MLCHLNEDIKKQVNGKIFSIKLIIYTYLHTDSNKRKNRIKPHLFKILDFFQN
jgi:hypothetical protein